MRDVNASGAIEIERLKFTRAVIDETMRLYPPAFLIARAAAGPDTIAGLPVKKHDVILIAPWLLHRHEKLWRDPNAVHAVTLHDAERRRIVLPTCRSASVRGSASARISRWSRQRWRWPG